VVTEGDVKGREGWEGKGRVGRDEENEREGEREGDPRVYLQIFLGITYVSGFVSFH